MKNVLLISSNFSHIFEKDIKKNINDQFGRLITVPLQLLYLSSLLTHKYNVKLVDLNLIKLWEYTNNQLENMIIDIINDYSPFVVGINCRVSMHIETSIYLAKVIKRNFPHIHIVLGGLHPTLFPMDIMINCNYIDFILQGEGEKTIVELCDCLNQQCDYSYIDGLVYRNNEQIKINPKLKYINNLDDILLPYDLINFNDYKQNTMGWYNPNNINFNIAMPITTSRSCLNNCNFCAVNRIMGHHFRMNSAQYVLDHIEKLYYEYDMKYFNIIDDDFTCDKQRVLDICNGLHKRNININFRLISGVCLNNLDDDIIDALAQTGLIWTQIPIESGSDYIRNTVIGKKLTKDKIFNIISSFNRYPIIMLRAYFIIGFPEDTYETIMDTYDMISELNVDSCAVPLAIPYPGTKLYNQCYKENLLINFENSWKNPNLFRKHNIGDFFIKPKNMSLETLSKLQYKLNELCLSKMSSRYRRLYD